MLFRSYERRQEVIDYVIEKYGADKVSQIITFGTMKAKAAIRDVGRALNMTYQEVDVIAKMVPFDLKMTIDKAIDLNPDLRDRYEEDIRVKNLIDMSKALESMPSGEGSRAFRAGDGGGPCFQIVSGSHGDILVGANFCAEFRTAFGC